MCDEHVDLWHQRWRAARKAHRCGECGFLIQPGTQYLEVRSLFDGRWSTDKRCRTCDAHWELYREFNEGCEVNSMLGEYEYEFQHDIADMFVLLDSTAAACMRESAA